MKEYSILTLGAHISDVTKRHSIVKHIDVTAQSRSQQIDVTGCVTWQNWKKADITITQHTQTGLTCLVHGHVGEIHVNHTVHTKTRPTKFRSCEKCGQHAELSSLKLVFSIEDMSGYYCRKCYAEHCRIYRNF